MGPWVTLGYPEATLTLSLVPSPTGVPLRCTWHDGCYNVCHTCLPTVPAAATITPPEFCGEPCAPHAHRGCSHPAVNVLYLLLDCQVFYCFNVGLSGFVRAPSAVRLRHVLALSRACLWLVPVEGTGASATRSLTPPRQVSMSHGHFP